MLDSIDDQVMSKTKLRKFNRLVIGCVMVTSSCARSRSVRGTPVLVTSSGKKRTLRFCCANKRRASRYELGKRSFSSRQVCSFVISTKNCVYSCHECIVGVDQILFASLLTLFCFDFVASWYIAVMFFQLHLAQSCL